MIAVVGARTQAREQIRRGLVKGGRGENLPSRVADKAIVTLAIERARA
jgi:hypothetical protein